MRGRLFALVVACAAVGAPVVSHTQVPVAQQTAGAETRPGSPERVLLDRYCVTCHNQKLKTAALTLDTMDPSNLGADPAGWEKVVRQLRSGAMPPAGRPRPDQGTYAGLRSHLETELDRFAAAAPDPGKVPAFQRLTRTEYQNAIRDLLALEDLPKAMDITVLLPADNATSGFDNIRELLFVSSTQLEQYLSAARKISRIAVGDPAMPLIVDRYAVSAELPQDVRIDGAPFGTRGGTVIRTNLPLDAEYSIEVEVAGGGRGHQLEIRVDGERAQLFTLGETANAPAPVARPDTSEEDASKAVTSAASTGTNRFDRDRRAAAARGAKGPRVLLPLKAGPREIVVTFIKHPSSRGEELVRPPLRGRGGQPGVSTVTIKGPYDPTGPGDTPSRRRLFVCRPSSRGDESTCARQILSTLVRRAYRRPAANADFQTLLPFYNAGRAQGGFETGIQWALERVLVSPEFLFRIEREPSAAAPNSVFRITDLELASRLSFFLWSSIPDDELLDVAIQGKLKDPQVLEHQVRRMLADARSSSLANNFAAQWLYLRDLEAKNPNERIFRDFDDGLKDALHRETELFVESILREDRNVLDLLNADYTFVNERLARHYGIPNVYGSEFQRVTLADDSPRRGLLGQGSILTLSSYATRTSPVLRGKYILDALLSTPTPPPPPNIPVLQEKSGDGKVLSMREAMVQHRANPSCAGCHARMDPLGFALENFDAVGRWRTRDDAGQPVDVAAALPDGTKFDGVAGLRQVLLKRSEDFVTGMTEKLLTYAVGRRTTYADAPAVRGIVREAISHDYHFSSFVLGIAKSLPFQMRRLETPAAATVPRKLD